MSNYISPTNQFEVIHPLFANVKVNNIKQIKQQQTIDVLDMVIAGFSYNEVSNRFLLERKTKISPQQVGNIVRRWMKPYKSLLRKGGQHV